MNLSKLQIYSVGVVAANKKLNSFDIEVLPLESMPFTSGEITDNKVDIPSKTKNADGVGTNTKLESTVSLKATWLPLGYSNRITPPDVRRGEHVAIYKFADTDKYWWIDLKQDLKLRKLETVIYAFSATQNEASTLDATNSYFLEISTHKKLITFHTSADNGEPYEYDITLNTDLGILNVTDNDGQVIHLNSNEKQIYISNKDGSKIEINKKDINITSESTVNIKTKNYTLEADTISEKCSSRTLSSSSNTITASSNTITAETAHTGNIQLNGSLTASGGGGQISMANGAMTSSGDVVASGKSLVNHVHTDSKGGSTTPPN